MSDYILKADPEKIKSQAGKISEEIKAIRKDYERIDNAVNSSKGYWEGNASLKNQKIYKELKEDFLNVLKRLDEHPRDLLEIAGLYIESEKVSKETVLDLSDDVIV